MENSSLEKIGKPIKNVGMTGGAYQGPGKRSGFLFQGVGKQMSFNRPSTGDQRRGIEVPGFVKPGIDYGSVAGTGAKFIGQGVLNLYRDPRVTWPFTPTVDGNQIRIGAGTANGIPIQSFSGSLTQGYYKAVITTDGEVVVSGTIQQGSPAAQTPSDDAAPTTVEVAIAQVATIPNSNPTRYYVRRMSGAGGISLIPYTARWVGQGCEKNRKVAWAVFT